MSGTARLSLAAVLAAMSPWLVSCSGSGELSCEELIEQIETANDAEDFEKSNRLDEEYSQRCRERLGVTDQPLD